MPMYSIEVIGFWHQSHLWKHKKCTHSAKSKMSLAQLQVWPELGQHLCTASFNEDLAICDAYSIGDA